MKKKSRKGTRKKHIFSFDRYYRYLPIIFVCLIVGYFSYSTVSHMSATPKEDLPSSMDSLKSDLESVDTPLGTNLQQSSTEPSTQTAQSPKATTNSNESSLTQWDKDGCQIGSSSYQVCRQNVFNAQCNSEWNVAYGAYHVAYNPIRASYDADLKAFQQELDSLVAQGAYTKGQTYGIWNNYVHERTQTFNAAVTPVYSKYTSSVATLNAKGCKINTSAISNPTLPF